MAPMTLDNVDEKLTTVISDIYELQNSAYGYQASGHQKLVTKVPELAANLLNLTEISLSLSSIIPPQVLKYVDEGRNPDIYTRELIEATQKTNEIVKSKSEAFASFRDILAAELTKAMPEIQSDVARILAGGPVVEPAKENGDMAGK